MLNIRNSDSDNSEAYKRGGVACLERPVDGRPCFSDLGVWRFKGSSFFSWEAELVIERNPLLDCCRVPDALIQHHKEVRNIFFISLLLLVNGLPVGVLVLGSSLAGLASPNFSSILWMLLVHVNLGE